MDDALIDRLGGEAGVRRLVDAFYDAMDTRPELAALRALHPPDLAHARDKLAWFLVGWTGGPPRYVERFGHPRLRARHLPFPIDSAARDAWMSAMRQALAETVADDAVRAVVDTHLARLADHMRNTPDPGAGGAP
jgi:hemoglobin